MRVGSRGAHKPAPRRKTESEGKDSGYEETRRSGVIEIPEAHEVTLAPNTFPLHTLGTGLVTTHTGAPTLCSRLLQGYWGSQTFPLSPYTAQRLSPLKISILMHYAARRLSLVEGTQVNPGLRCGTGDGQTVLSSLEPPLSPELASRSAPADSFIKGCRPRSVSPAAAPLAPRQGPALGGDEEAH